MGDVGLVLQCFCFAFAWWELVCWFQLCCVNMMTCSESGLFVAMKAYPMGLKERHIQRRSKLQSTYFCKPFNLAKMDLWKSVCLCFKWVMQDVCCNAFAWWELVCWFQCCCANMMTWSESGLFVVITHPIGPTARHVRRQNILQRTCFCKPFNWVKMVLMTKCVVVFQPGDVGFVLQYCCLMGCLFDFNFWLSWWRRAIWFFGDERIRWAT